MCPTLNADADRELFDAVAEKICQDIPGTTYLSYEETDAMIVMSRPATEIASPAAKLVLSSSVPP